LITGQTVTVKVHRYGITNTHIHTQTSFRCKHNTQHWRQQTLKYSNIFTAKTQVL